MPKSRSKYYIGEVITTLEELMKQDSVYFMGKVINKGWFQNWQIGWANAYVKRGAIFKAVRKEVSNAERRQEV